MRHLYETLSHLAFAYESARFVRFLWWQWRAWRDESEYDPRVLVRTDR
jgi:hypothetical protein